MKKVSSILFALLLLLSSIIPASAAAVPASTTMPRFAIPTFTIIAVAADQSVTIRTHNFPANDTFDVLMGKMGTKAINGVKVASVQSGKGGSFDATYNIPAELKGRTRVAIRLQSSTGSGYFAYNWFYNNTTGGGGNGTGGVGQPGSSYSGIPTFSIVSVVADTSVTIRTNNFPANDTFDVRMGRMGTRGVNGVKAATVQSGKGGTFEAVYQIPAELKGLGRIAIRLESPTSGYFAFNWFFNNTAGGGSGTGGAGQPGSGYSGIPTFSISAVVRNTSVTISAKNLPAKDKFDVRMGAMGTRGVNGIFVTTIDSGQGGSQNFTFNVPAALAGSRQIAIRLESPTSGYFAFNWFFNNTTN